MAGAILGALIGLIFSGIIGLAGYYLYESTCNKKAEIITAIATWIICIAITIPPTLIGYSYDKHSYTRWIYQYNASKQTIEESIDNEKLSGFERVELVGQATTLNKQLEGLKYDCEQWYGIAIDKDILELEAVTFD